MKLHTELTTYCEHIKYTGCSNATPLSSGIIRI
jgi:hypothetical protein